MGRILSWLANSVLFVLCCYIVADTANDVFAALLTPSPEEKAEAAVVASAPSRHSWADREIILGRNLFNASLLAPAEPEVVAEESEELEETKLPLRLLGTAAAMPAELSWAAVEDETERRTYVVGIKDSIRSAVVERIERRRIVLREGGDLRELVLDEEEPGTSPARVARATAPRARTARTNARARALARANPRTRATAPEPVREVGKDQFEVQRDDVDDMLQNPATLFSQARILPKYEAGQMVGLQVNAIKPGSLFEDIGIQSGDVITKLNGITINDPQESAEILAEFSEAESFTVDVERSDGSSDTLEFSFEDSE
jgi:general secretion pathway protein C